MDDVSRYYKVLGLEPGATPEEVKQAYRDLVRVWHPDRFSHDERLRQIAQDKLKEINGAYEVLTANAFEASSFEAATPSPESEGAPETGSPEEATAPKGRTPVLPIVAVLAIVLIAGAGFLIWKNSQTHGATGTANSTPAPVPVETNRPSGAAATEVPRPTSTTLVDKTLVAWVTVGNLTKRAGSVISCFEDSEYDDLSFGERDVSKWSAGSEWWHRGCTNQDFPVETADPNTVIQIAITYRDRETALYRNGKLLLRYMAGGKPRLFDSESFVLFGIRAAEVHDRYAGTILDARIYDQALTLEQIGSLKPNEAANPAPWAWWNFADGTGKDVTGHFGTIRLIDGAKLENGRLVLDGVRAAMVAGRSPEQIEKAFPTPVAGRCALSLNCGWVGVLGNNSYTVSTNSAVLKAPFTVESWAWSRENGNGQTMIGSRAPTEHGFALKLEAAKIHADIGNGSDWLTTQAEVPFKYQRNTWYHIACVVTSSRCTFYVNGALAGYKDYPAGTPLLCDSEHYLHVGSISGTGEFFLGYLADVRVWQTARTQAEIHANMKRRLSGNEPGLRAYLPFDEGANLTAKDRTGSGFDGALLGEAEWTTNAPPLTNSLMAAKAR